MTEPRSTPGRPLRERRFKSHGLHAPRLQFGEHRGQRAQTRVDRETVKRSELADVADYGWCGSHSRYFWGFRLHAIFAPDGTPRAVALTSPKRDEREIALKLLERCRRRDQIAHHSDGTLSRPTVASRKCGMGRG